MCAYNNGYSMTSCGRPAVAIIILVCMHNSVVTVCVLIAMGTA